MLKVCLYAEVQIQRERESEMKHAEAAQSEKILVGHFTKQQVKGLVEISSWFCAGVAPLFCSGFIVTGGRSSSASKLGHAELGTAGVSPAPCGTAGTRPCAVGLTAGLRGCS